VWWLACPCLQSGIGATLMQLHESRMPLHMHWSDRAPGSVCGSVCGRIRTCDTGFRRAYEPVWLRRRKGVWAGHIAPSDTKRNHGVSRIHRPSTDHRWASLPDSETGKPWNGWQLFVRALPSHNLFRDCGAGTQAQCVVGALTCVGASVAQSVSWRASLRRRSRPERSRRPGR
jgi:hypothetical protein